MMHTWEAWGNFWNWFSSSAFTWCTDLKQGPPKGMALLGLALLE